ncbi:pentapeptide repeat-containing protein [Calothrix membranacea FACHB-236]|nr:pentapeptide repeat-containing protein [Calothrix membranacea FACHB-236]
MLINWRAIAHRIELRERTDLGKPFLSGTDLSYARLSLTFLRQVRLNSAKLYRAIFSTGILQNNCVSALKDFGLHTTVLS